MADPRRGLPGILEAAGLWLPVTLLALTLAGMLAWNTHQLVRERETLATVRAGQEASVEEGRKVRAQLDVLAGRVGQLAGAGNPQIQRIVDDLRRQGISINVPGGGAGPPR